MERFDLRQSDEQLTFIVGRFGRAALEARQVARRLSSLLPNRLRDLKQEHAARLGKAALAERFSYTDPRYLAFVDELVGLHADARQAQVQYETHRMLFEARRSLRLWRARR